MMWLLIVAWLALVGAAAIFAQQAFGFNLDEAPRQFWALPVPEQVTVGAVAALALFVIVSSVLQARRLSLRNKTVNSLRMSLDGIRKQTTQADEAQRNLDAAGASLSNSEPEEAIASLQKRLADVEQRTAFQQSRNEGVDLQDRLEDIRQRQHALRRQIGQVTDKRRTIEPVFGELKERQSQLEGSLAEIETDDNRNSLASRLKEVSSKVSQVHARLKALEESWETLGRFKQEFDESKTRLVRLRAPETGLAAMIDELHVRRDQLAQTLGELETHGDEQLGARVEALAKSKLGTEQRIARLDDCFMILDTIRRDFDELEERQAHLERALAEVETDPTGRTLIDRQNGLNEFAAQARLRVRVLQDTSTALHGFRQDMDKSQAALVPMQAPADGIEALIGDLQARRDRLVKTLNEIELNGDEKLGARVEALYRSKIETEQRIVRISEEFARLDAIRKEIVGLFAKLGGTIDTLR